MKLESLDSVPVSVTNSLSDIDLVSDLPVFSASRRDFRAVAEIIEQLPDASQDRIKRKLFSEYVPLILWSPKSCVLSKLELGKDKN